MGLARLSTLHDAQLPPQLHMDPYLILRFTRGSSVFLLAVTQRRLKGAAISPVSYMESSFAREYLRHNGGRAIGATGTYSHSILFLPEGALSLLDPLLSLKFFELMLLSMGLLTCIGKTLSVSLLIQYSCALPQESTVHTFRGES